MQPFDTAVIVFTVLQLLLQILGQVMKSVTALHGTGLAHRNIKPSNIIQRPKQHDWVLSDFAASCPFGAPAHDT